ncbi:MAG: hypothetical protein JWN22_1918 [Nocardioides sp.]|nr:hypothetical protein [Nocardioides sp.]
MNEVPQIDELDEAEILDRLDDLHRTRRRAEVEVLRLAVRFAVLHDEHTLDPARSALPGRERAVRFGGEGTPLVTEFCAAELGARLQLTPWAARVLMADALDLNHRLPQLWRRVEALEVKESYARHVARRTRDLTPEQAAYVDSRVVEAADGRIPWSRFEALVEGAVAAADPEAAAERERRARRDQHANPTRSTEDGMRGFHIRAPFPVIARLDATIAHLADALAALGDDTTLDERRVLAVLILANPHQAVQLLQEYAAWRAAQPAETGGDGGPPEAPTIDPATLLPAVMLFVHMYAGPEPTGIARVEGVGPVTQTWVRDLLGPQAQFTIQPVLDIEGQAPVDAYDIPDRHRQAVHLRTPADTFPFASNTSRKQQIDHTVPYQHGADRPGGQSRLGNYGPMTAFHHRIKTFGRWTVKQPFPGLYLWRDPHGAVYLVDHTGTRRVDLAA